VYCESCQLHEKLTDLLNFSVFWVQFAQVKQKFKKEELKK